MEDIQDYVISLMKNEWGHDELKIQIALRPGATLTDAKIRQRLQSSLRIVPEINYSGIPEIHKIQIVEGKRKISKLIDLR